MIDSIEPDDNEFDQIENKKDRKFASECKEDIINDQTYIRELLENELRNKKWERSQVKSILQEYLRTFIVIGYDHNGELINPIVNTADQQAADSLITSLNRIMMGLAKKTFDLGGDDF